VVVNHSYFQQNTATSEGGAIADYESLTLDNTIFNHNFGPEYGGAVYTDDGATIHGITLKNNQAYYGGGLYNDDVMTLTRSSFANNTAVYGGGMYNEDEATVDGTTFQQNSASTAGGGIYEDGTFTHLHSSRVTFNHAPSGEGGGIYNNDTVTLAGTVVRFNTVNNCAPALSVPGCTG
jgi:predicted outer membrane repeat protein